MQLVENTERSLREKFTDTRSSLAEADAKVRNSEAEIKQLKMELEHSKKVNKNAILYCSNTIFFFKFFS